MKLNAILCRCIHDCIAKNKNESIASRFTIDLAWFYYNAINSNIIMGSNTYNQLCKFEKKSVFNIAKHTYVITRNPANFENTNKVSFYTYEQFLQEFETSNETFLVCGGAQIYNLFAEHTASWFVTTIKNPCTNKHENSEFKVNKLKSLKFVKTIVANGSCNGYNFNIVELN